MSKATELRAITYGRSIDAPINYHHRTGEVEGEGGSRLDLYAQTESVEETIIRGEDDLAQSKFLKGFRKYLRKVFSREERAFLARLLSGKEKPHEIGRALGVDWFKYMQSLQRKAYKNVKPLVKLAAFTGWSRAEEFTALVLRRLSLLEEGAELSELLPQNARILKIKEKRRAYERANAERILATRREYDKTHRKEKAARNAKYRAVHRDQIKEYKRSYHIKNREKVIAKRRAYYQANREALVQQKREYREAHREEINAKRREELRNDPQKREEHRRRAREYYANVEAKYRKEHREEVLAAEAEYRETHREAIKIKNARYRERNREKIRQQNREYRARKKAEREGIRDAERDLAAYKLAMIEEAGV